LWPVAKAASVSWFMKPSTIQGYDDVGRLDLEIRVDLAVAAPVHHFEQVHEVPSPFDLLSRDDGLVLIVPSHGLHLQEAIGLDLGHASVQEPDPSDARRVVDASPNVDGFPGRGPPDRYMHERGWLSVFGDDDSDRSGGFVWREGSPPTGDV